MIDRKEKPIAYQLRTFSIFLNHHLSPVLATQGPGCPVARGCPNARARGCPNARARGCPSVPQSLRPKCLWHVATVVHRNSSTWLLCSFSALNFQNSRVGISLLEKWMLQSTSEMHHVIHAVTSYCYVSAILTFFVIKPGEDGEERKPLMKSRALRSTSLDFIRVVLSSSSLVLVEVKRWPLCFFWQIFWHYFWHFSWHSFYSNISFDMFSDSDISAGISSDTLSDILSDISSRPGAAHSAS